MLGKGAFKIEAGEKTLMIEAHAARHQQLATHSEDSKKLRGTQLQYSPQPASIALSMCLVAEGRLDNTLSLTNTMEWETAGAHAVINSAGMTVINPETDSELTYNKEYFRTVALILK